jgi:hypothetical protein
MKFSARQVWAVHCRLRDLERRPRLFDDRMPAGRVRARLERFERWAGSLLWFTLIECERKRELPRPDWIEAELERRSRIRRRNAETSPRVAGYVAGVDMGGGAK